MIPFRRITSKKSIIALCCIFQFSMVVFQLLNCNSLYRTQQPQDSLYQTQQQQDVNRHRIKLPAPARRGDQFPVSAVSPLQASCENYFANFKAPSSQQQVLQSIRIYNKCYLQNQFTLPASGSSIEQQLFPYLNFNPPIYTRWNNETLQLPLTAKSKAGFWSQFQQQFSGDGIIISIHDNQDNIKQAGSLLRVLRFLKNELPIQFIHKGDLSSCNQQLLINAARNCGESLETSIDNLDKRQNCHQQDIWFVDVSPAISHGYHAKFSRFANKWLAMLFSSFQRVIIMDTDVVPFVKPSQLLDSSNGKSWFFHDRNLPEYIHPTSLQYYKSLLPSSFEQSNFTITTVPSQFLQENPFFRSGQKHLMDSGLVVMNRTTHNFGGLITSVNLQMDRRTSKPVYGDKELFWLGQVVAGNHDSFIFNKAPAAAIGKFDTRARKLCSTQMAHFESRQGEPSKLLWTNGCLNKCKKYNYSIWLRAWDTMRHPGLMIQHEGSLSKIQQYYNKPVDLSHGLIPSEPSKTISIRNSRSMTQANFKKDKSLGCNGYFYCAYMDDDSMLDSSPTMETKTELIEFKGEYHAFLNEVVRVWNSN